MQVAFPNGVIVAACPLSERRELNPERDFGLYLDAGWKPTWDATVIDWADFGVPGDPELAARRIVAAFERARRGERLEIGCRGGIGRTGTVLACMAVLAGVAPADAVGWVRRTYHPEAVETAEQERWVLWFGDHVA